MNNVINQAPYLIVSRQFSLDDQSKLSTEVNRSYTDIANAVNTRTIGFFPVNKSVITGEAWFVSQNRKQQGLRQVFPFSDANLVFNHNLSMDSVAFFKPIIGNFYTGSTWENLPYVDVTNVNNQIKVSITNTQIVITKGAGAPPAIQSGYLVLEWISNP